MNVTGRDADLAGDRASLRQLLGHHTLALEHVLEIGVAAEVELIRVIQFHATLAEQIGEHTVHDGRAHLTLDVVAHDRQTREFEAPSPVRIGCDEHRNTIHERAPGLYRTQRIPFRRTLRAHWQMRDQHLRAGFFQHLHDIRFVLVRFDQVIFQIATDAIERAATMNFDTELRQLGEDARVVRVRKQRFREIFTDLMGGDVERPRSHGCR